MLIQSEVPVGVVRVGVSPWAEEGPETWYRVVSKNVTPRKDCHLAPVAPGPHLSAHL